MTEETEQEIAKLRAYVMALHNRIERMDEELQQVRERMDRQQREIESLQHYVKHLMTGED